MEEPVRDTESVWTILHYLVEVAFTLRCQNKVSLRIFHRVAFPGVFCLENCTLWQKFAKILPLEATLSSSELRCCATLSFDLLA
ncbi:hypothetical protein L873DRAFT_1799404 [Choiromyces venosus 120613-1]|uniref:Uncharacterized protein n=1 Tax=Choiromyces venosus 120613-1 TaxID=1336337 RepID=A0A3N4K4M8_9PEZI|nr:hypothetical protein L873DRAFT_1799404 [Choiromyces venosus 120613-1]